MSRSILSKNKRNLKSNKTKKLITRKASISKTYSRLTEADKLNYLINKGLLLHPQDLRIGYLSKPINGSRYIVKKDKTGNKYYTLANKEEIECDTLLKKNMSKYISIYKSSKGKGPFKTFNNAKSFALKQTKKVYPKCLIVNGKLNKDKENQTYLRSMLNDIKYYTKYGYYKLFKFF